MHIASVLFSATLFYFTLQSSPIAHIQLAPFFSLKSSKLNKKKEQVKDEIIKTASTTYKATENTTNLHFSLQYDKKHHLIIQQDTSQQLRQLLINMI